jgi:HlyD family secretion protein
MRSRRIILLLLVVILAIVGIGYYVQQRVANSGRFVLSGTIETTEINLPAMTGGRVREVYVAEGDSVKRNQELVRTAGEIIRSPIDGVVLERLVEPGEFAAPGSTSMVVAPLDELTLKVYVPEDRYGQVALGQTYAVTVDSFPNQTFQGTVKNIADKAEFTPRNVQTTDSRKTTVYAVTLDLAPSGGRLKPSMPADVHFHVQ